MTNHLQDHVLILIAKNDEMILVWDANVIKYFNHNVLQSQNLQSNANL